MIHELEADSIQLEFDGRIILSDVYLKCETGKITGLLGRNGQGKSCLMKIIHGSLRCERSVRFDKLVQAEAFKKPGLVTYLPQFNFIPKYLSLKRIFLDFNLDYSGFEKRFPEFTSKYQTAIGDLSGGERRLVEIYVVLISNSNFALLDEPFTHLNLIQIEKLMELLLEEKKSKGLLITDHMYRHVVEVSDDLYVLANRKTHLVKNIRDFDALGYLNIR